MPGEAVTVDVLARRIGAAPPGDTSVVTDVHHDSRSVTPHSVFVAITGDTHDGHEFVQEALDRGASAVISERPLPSSIPTIVVTDARGALAAAAAAVHGHPGDQLDLIGITGTDGKTTVTHMIHSIATSAGLPAGVIGTLGARIRDEEVPLARTTPEASDIQRLLAAMVASGVGPCAMEVSSHALVLHRVDALRFRVAGFTNLSQDHLDFHGDMDTYFAAKRLLFDRSRADRAVISIDDAWGARLAREVDIPVVGVGRSPGADVRADAVEGDRSGTSFRLQAGEAEATVRLPLPGRFNVENALVAAATAMEIGIGFGAVCEGLDHLGGMPGRFEAVSGPWPFQVIVDYAHTPRAVAAAVAEARAIGGGKVIAVVGAGGDRDQDKRPMMGAAAGSADLAVITSDNPRSEDPAHIVSAVAAGVPADRLIAEVDRATAIQRALEEAGPSDIVLVLGKGHEAGQEFADGRVEPFDDRDAALAAWSAARGGAPK